MNMKKFSFALATLILFVAPLAASAYSYMPMYRPAYSYPSDPRYSMYNVQRGAQMLTLQDKRYNLGTDCSDYGYGDCAERMAWSGSSYGPGWMITNPQTSYYGGGYGQQYQPSYYGYGGYGSGYGNSYYGGGYPSSYGGYSPSYGGYGSSYGGYGGYYGY